MLKVNSPNLLKNRIQATKDFHWTVISHDLGVTYLELGEETSTHVASASASAVTCAGFEIFFKGKFQMYIKEMATGKKKDTTHNMKFFSRIRKENVANAGKSKREGTRRKATISCLDTTNLKPTVARLRQGPASIGYAELRKKKIRQIFEQNLYKRM